MTLARPEALRRSLAPSCDRFHESRDGFAIDFRLFGTTLQPQTDLPARIGKAAASGAARDQINRLFKRKIF
jgi:hypothetical protein